MGKGLDFDQLFPNRFMKAGEFEGRDVTLTVARVTTEELPDEKLGMKTRGILSFVETKKQLTLNKTNGLCIRGMFGRDTGEWVGKRITLFPMNVEAFGAMELAIRVRGSPDIEKSMQVELKLAKKKPRMVTMQKTVRKASGKAAPVPVESPPPPEPDEAEQELIRQSELEQSQPPPNDDVPF